jgi:RsmE family RNA methyltransferase
VSDNLTTLPVGHDPGEPLLLAVGPEGGWSEYELERFVDAGFHPFSMGERILHVDTAVVALLAQLRLLYDLRSR